MNQTHIHLLITHLPIFGSILGGLVLLHGIGTKSNQTIIAAYNIFVLSAIGAGIAYFTGEAAEETVENIQGVAEATIKTHEEFALYALICLIFLGLTSIIGLFLTITKSSFIKSTAIFILFVSFVSFGLVARTGFLGGQIRHTELTNGAIVPTEHSENEDDD
jgi:hypothetical protein